MQKSPRLKNCVMKKFLIVVSVVAMLPGASAGQPVREWHLFYKEDENTRDYMDILSIKEVKHNVIVVTTLTENDTPGATWLSAIFDYEINCSTKRMTQTAQAYFGGNLGTGGVKDANSQRMQMPQNDINLKIENIVCGIDKLPLFNPD